MIKNRHFLFILLCLVQIVMLGQNNEALSFVISGEVRDQVSGKKLENVNITAPQRHLATVTNADGRFTLKTTSRPAYITVSHVGYRSQHVALNEKSANLKIKLVPANIVLRDVHVYTLDPSEVLHEAMSRIKDNYSNESELFTCFYRETAKKRDKFITVAEAVVDMYKSSYDHAPNSDRVAIVKARRLVSQKSGDTLGVRMQGGPTEAVWLDVVKNRGLLLNTEDLHNYTLKMQDPVMINDRQQNVIAATPNNDMLDYALYYVTFYIDLETRAFTRVELSLDMRNSDKATRQMLVKKPRGVHFKPKELSLIVNYRQEEGISRLSYIRSTYRFNCDWKRRLFSTGFTAVNELVVTDRRACDKNPIDRKEAFGPRDSFTQMVNDFSDTDFWRDYNIIEPTESLEHAIKKLKKTK